MYTDNTLTPKEAVRLCALGVLSLGPKRYSALAQEIRHFVSHILGPSLDVMGQSIELLRYEGLVTPTGGKGISDDAELEITDDGRQELHTLLTSRLRFGATELNKLIVALKFRFLHVLPADERAEQVALMQEFHENELARLTELRVHHAEDEGYLAPWLDHDIALVEDRLRWLEDFGKGL